MSRFLESIKSWWKGRSYLKSSFGLMCFSICSISLERAVGCLFLQWIIILFGWLGWNFSDVYCCKNKCPIICAADSWLCCPSKWEENMLPRRKYGCILSHSTQELALIWKGNAQTDRFPQCIWNVFLGKCHLLESPCNWALCVGMQWIFILYSRMKSTYYIHNW